MSNPLRNFDSRQHDKKFEEAGVTIGLPALFGSMDARDDFIRRDAGEATYFDPGRSAQRKVGTWVSLLAYTKVDPADASIWQDAADFQDAGYDTMKKAFDDEGLGDYFEDAFPYKLIVWMDTRAIAFQPTWTHTPAFPTHATVFSHAAGPTDDSGVLMASHIATVLGGTTLASQSTGGGVFVDNAYPHKAATVGGSAYANPDVNTDGQHTLYGEAYGRNDVPLTSNVDFILTEPEGVALKAFFDAANPTGLDLKDSVAAASLQLLLTRHANLPIFYLEPFDNLTNAINTPF